MCHIPESEIEKALNEIEEVEKKESEEEKEEKAVVV